MYEGPVVYVDLETSGGSYINSRIIEIGAIRVEGGEIVDSFKTLVNPGKILPPWITKLTGIESNDLIQAPYFEDIAWQFHHLLEEAVFIAHNVNFDYSFVRNELRSCGYEYKPALLCTVKLSRCLYTEYTKHNLQSLIERHSIAVSNRHRAYDDAMAIKEFAETAYKEKGANKFKQAISKQLAVPRNRDVTRVTR